MEEDIFNLDFNTEKSHPPIADGKNKSRVVLIIEDNGYKVLGENTEFYLESANRIAMEIKLVGKNNIIQDGILEIKYPELTGLQKEILDILKKIPPITIEQISQGFSLDFKQASKEVNFLISNNFYFKFPKLSNNGCYFCGFNKILEEHHILPKIMGGKYTDTLLLCPNCHRLLHSKMSCAIRLRDGRWVLYRNGNIKVMESFTFIKGVKQ